MKGNKCPKCDSGNLVRKRSTAHGLPSTHIRGTERIECACGLYVDSAEEAEAIGLLFIFDKDKKA